MCLTVTWPNGSPKLPAVPVVSPLGGGVKGVPQLGPEELQGLPVFVNLETNLDSIKHVSYYKQPFLIDKLSAE